ncbi:MAG: LysR family transcriptional regulator [Novosphingobium sp. 28-62-57]|nr:MAG: LysR family transcriptional regulator [Novosphingobium sp. 12-62-10]OYZ10357.1 MAG: LysR family transcriptional regulator [Novosphingobium sp. 28-62-57]OZA37169.1 MAG: LysR family transcriptional regulator [Novosphingobium sp. 17-62-9]HQS68077.1 LysR family transcriptional regulator [Novosphingobium sp.]
MRMENFDLNLLVAFEILLEERSVTRAAQRLNVTQSAMSASLKRLRESFQDDILVLHGKKMIPTQHALNLAPEVSASLVRLKSLITGSTRFDPAHSKRRFRICTSDYLIKVLMGRLLEQLQVEAPSIRLDFTFPNAQSPTRLEADDIDLLLTPEDFVTNEHPSEMLFEERHVVAGWAGNPVMQAPITRESFLECGHVVVQISNREIFIEAILLKMLPERRIEIVAPSFIQAPWMVRGTNRLTVMHERLAQIMAPTLDLVIAEPPFPLPMMREMMQWHSARSNDEGLLWLRQRIRDIAGST